MGSFELAWRDPRWGGSGGFCSWPAGASPAPPGWDSSTPALCASLSPQSAEAPGTATGLWLKEGCLDSGGAQASPFIQHKLRCPGHVPSPL